MRLWGFLVVVVWIFTPKCKLQGIKTQYVTVI